MVFVDGGRTVAGTATADGQLQGRNSDRNGHNIIFYSPPLLTFANAEQIQLYFQIIYQPSHLNIPLFMQLLSPPRAFYASPPL